jgi:hypothetical protein
MDVGAVDVRAAQRRGAGEVRVFPSFPVADAIRAAS